MKNIAFLFLMLGLFTSTFAQKLKKIVLNRTVGCSISREVFYVREDQPELRQGAYKESASYFDVRGQYENGFRSGIWEYSDRRGITQRYDFTNHKVIMNVPSSGPYKSWILDDQGSVVRELNELPLFLGGADRFYSYLGQCLRFPPEAIANRKNGVVVLNVTISKEGKLVDAIVVGDPGYGYAAAALKAVSAIPQEWIPYEIAGKPVDVRLEIKANFSFGR